MNDDGIDQKARLAEARAKALDYAKSLAGGAIAYVEYLLREEKTISKRAKALRDKKNEGREKTIGGPLYDLPYAAKQLLSHSKQIQCSLDMLADAGHVEHALNGYESLHRLLIAAKLAGENGVPTDEAIDKADDTRTLPAREKIKLKLQRRRDEIEAICRYKGWGLRQTDSLYPKILKELEARGKQGPLGFELPTERQIESDMAAIMKSKKAPQH